MVSSVFDSHCHLDLIPTEIRDEVLTRARLAGIKKIVIPGVTPSQWGDQSLLASEDIRCAYGIHPWHVKDADVDSAFTELRTLLKTACAIGETGLDALPRNKPHLPLQRAVFRKHLLLAQETELPVILHVVRTHSSVVEELQQHPGIRGVVHSFSGNAQQATAYVKQGICVSFSGAICDPSRIKLRQAVQAVPDAHLLVETDAPDQTPHSRKPAKNEPAFLRDVIQAVADIRGQSFAEISEITAENSMALFGF